MKTTQRFAAAMLSVLLTASVYGCAAPQRAPGNGRGAGAPGTFGGTGGTNLGARGRTGTAGLGGGTTGAGGGTLGTGGGVLGGLTGGATGANRVELGQQISTFVAGIPELGGGAAAGPTGMQAGAAGGAGATGGAGAAANRNIGVSTLVVGNMAFIAVDMRTVHGAGSAAPQPGVLGTVGSSGGGSRSCLS